MRNIHSYSAVKSAVLFTFILIVANSLFARTETTTDAALPGAEANPKTVNNQQSSARTSQIISKISRGTLVR